MSNVRFIGCLHFGHPFIAKNRGFYDEYHHDEFLIKSWNSVVTNKKDLTYILGDITMENPDYYFQLDRLAGRKIVVLGNHDLPQHVKYLLDYVEGVAGMIDYKGFCLTHVPIHPDEIGFYEGNIHAHIHHENTLANHAARTAYNDEKSKVELTLHKYHNVDAKLINFRPRTLDQLRADNAVWKP